MTQTYHPSGMSIGVNLGALDEPLLSLIFQDPHWGDIEVVLTEVEAAACIAIASEGLQRAAVMREMLTMFPEQRDAILTNLLFRWTGEISDGSGA